MESSKIEKLAKKYCDWANSPEGSAKLDRSSEKSRRNAEEILEKSQVDEETLRKHYTI
ncbi:MAG: hypothetical protein KZQ98_02755 [Candidatus Thiodiazotropha sp. (ex Lucinoma borealis)]|nr:hypothetical protein [Candidatus Thiodiazotropha sp. (ex Lucinoma borealis)]